jgi:hypothetical protein
MTGPSVFAVEAAEFATDSEPVALDDFLFSGCYPGLTDYLNSGTPQ